MDFVFSGSLSWPCSRPAFLRNWLEYLKIDSYYKPSILVQQNRLKHPVNQMTVHIYLVCMYWSRYGLTNIDKIPYVPVITLTTWQCWRKRTTFLTLCQLDWERRHVFIRVIWVTSLNEKLWVKPWTFIHTEVLTSVFCRCCYKAITNKWLTLVNEASKF